ncbi:MAG: hypothetical protein O6857_08150, partial [Nitrospinae bacterium]|nr:hypothetical protein [Nitrospinota bacterium]
INPKTRKNKPKVNPWNLIPLKSCVVVQPVKSVGLESQAGEMEKKSCPEMKVPPNYKRYLMGPKQAGRFCFIIRTTKTQTNFTKENYPRRFKSGVAPELNFPPPL